MGLHVWHGSHSSALGKYLQLLWEGSKAALPPQASLSEWLV